MKKISKSFVKLILPLMVLMFVQTAIRAQDATPKEQECFNMVQQNNVAWNKAGQTNWDPSNIRLLCAGTTNPIGTINCFKVRINKGDDYQQATDFCVDLSLPTLSRPLEGWWTGVDAGGTETSYIWHIVQAGKQLSFEDVGAGTGTKFSGSLRGDQITDSNGVTGKVVANVMAIKWSDGVIWKRRNAPAGVASGRKIILMNKGGYEATLSVTYFDTSGDTLPVVAFGNKITTLKTDSIDIPATKTYSTIIVSITNNWSGKQFFTTTVPANFTGELCFRSEGSTFSPNAARCDGTIGETVGAIRKIRFQNDAGYDARMIVEYWTDETVGGVLTPTQKSVDTGFVNGLGDKFRLLSIPAKTSDSRTVRIRLVGNATLKGGGDVYATDLAGNFAAAPEQCFKVTGTLFIPSGGPCTAAGDTPYDFQIKTADVNGAGTDANISLRICGDKGCTAMQVINHLISGNAFEQNQTDTFTLKDRFDVGIPSYIEIQSDTEANFLNGAAWDLERITISKDGHRYTFRVNGEIKDRNVHRLNVTESN